MKLLTIILLIAALFSAACAQGDIEIEGEVSRSALTQIALPDGTFRVREQTVPAQYKQLLKMYIDGNPLFSQGKIELLVLTGATQKIDSAKLRAQVETNLKSDGWAYKVLGEEQGVMLFTAVKKSPARTNIFGYWVPEKDGLMLVMEEVLVSGQSAKTNDKSTVSNPKQTPNVSSGAETFNLSADETYVNVMGNAAQPDPAFPATAVKPGKARGYVKDLKGNPLEGAVIGVRSTAFGGVYTTASAETDAKGFYEFEIPTGAAYFYTAGYTIDYGEGRVALVLRPADGKVGGFSAAQGVVKNFTLPTYGVANRNKAASEPQDNRNYYGGTLRINFKVSTLPRAPENILDPGSLVVGEEIEITLAPDGEMLDGTTGKTFVIRRQTSDRLINYFFVNNIPVGRYKISARLTNGKQLQLHQFGAAVIPTLGLKPKTAVGSASLLLSADADNVLVDPSQGNWDEVNIELSLP